ncbi:MAG: PIN domain-containing protein [Alphaproteobacteria bacterium]|nr:PIN domain-containing protein [Alphaproteobacteria bacterium]MCY3754887.1 PIN domain-containing protein [Alphaproteobacteria bacterium]
MTIFFDTNVLVYAQGPGIKGDKARQALTDGGVISVQVVNEFANVLRRKFRLEWNIVAAAVADVRELFDSIRPVDIETHEAAIALAEAHGFSFYDSLIVASALQAGCETLLTEDLQAGRRIDSLVIVNPFAADR